MKHHRQKIERINMRPLLEPFIPLLARQNWEVVEETDANRRWHLSSKEYQYQATLTGHLPIHPQ